MKQTEYYTPQEVADMLKLKVETIWRKIRSGDIEAIKFGNRYRISEEELNRIKGMR